MTTLSDADEQQRARIIASHVYTCPLKRRYRRRHEAKRARSKHPKKRQGPRLMVYRCTNCDYYHLGRSMAD